MDCLTLDESDTPDSRRRLSRLRRFGGWELPQPDGSGDVSVSGEVPTAGEIPVGRQCDLLCTVCAQDVVYLGLVKEADWWFFTRIG